MWSYVIFGKERVENWLLYQQLANEDNMLFLNDGKAEDKIVEYSYLLTRHYPFQQIFVFYHGCSLLPCSFFVTENRIPSTK